MAAGTPPVAVVGLSALMPGAVDVDAFWRNVVLGRDLITEVPVERWSVQEYYDPDPQAPDKTYCRRGGFLPEIDFDPLQFRFPPNNLASTDIAQLLTLVAADAVLTDAIGGRPLDGERVSVIIGSAGTELSGQLAARLGRPTWRRVLLEHGIPSDAAEAICDRIAEQSPPWQESSLPGMLGNIVAGRVANTFDLHGANFTVDAACAGSLAAVSAAVDELALGRADLVITGGADMFTSATSFVAFSKMPVLSPTGDCRPFAENADGIVLGEGVALFALKRLADAERDGDQVYAVIRGIGAASDGCGTSIFAPLESGQELALRRAYQTAGYGPDTVQLVEAHGTATRTGDRAELGALRTVFGGPGRASGAWCVLGSVKSQIGHLKAAAGAAGLLKAVLAVHHKVLPPTIKVDRPYAELGLADSPFYLNTTSRPWLHTAPHPRRAGVSSFGFGGTNFHLTLEEYVPSGDKAARVPARSLARPAELVLLSGSSRDEVVQRGRSMVDGRRLAAMAQQSQREYDATAPARLAVVATDPAQVGDAVELLTHAAEESFTTPTGVHYGHGRPGRGRVAFLFPGQGSQYTGMGSDLAIHFPTVQQLWADVPVDGLSTVVFSPSRTSTSLDATEWTQPAIAAHSLALLTLLEALGVRPDCAAGHSLGELVALHAARAIGHDDLLMLTRRRGELLRDAVAATGVPAAMLAVDATAKAVETLLGHNVWIANHNASEQVVLSGATAAIDAIAERLAQAGIRARRLAVSAPFHTPMVASAAEPFLAALHEVPLRAPLIDVYRNTETGCYPPEPDKIRHALAAHLTGQVRFTDMITTMYADGVRTFVEVGPGSVLTGLVGVILASEPHQAIPLDRRGRHGVTSLLDGMARLAVLGIPMTFDPLWKQHPDRPVPTRSAHTIKLTGSNVRPQRPTKSAAPTVPAAPALVTPAPVAAAPTVTALVAAAPVVPAAATLAAASPAAAAVDSDNSTLHAILETQRQIADAHTAYLRVAEASIAALTSLTGGGPAPLAATPPRTPLPLSMPAAPALPPVPADTAPGSHPVTAPVPRPVNAELDLVALVREIIAERTGYPVSLLEPHMSLEADLGIDSISRAQMLAALRPRFPILATLDQERLTEFATASTIADIADRLRELSRPTAATPITRMTWTAHPAQPTGQPMPGLSTGRLLVTPIGTGIAEAVVAELGYHGIDATVGDTPRPGDTGVIFLGGLTEVSSPRHAADIQRTAFHLARTVAPTMTATGGVFVTVHDGTDSTDRAWLAGLSALAATAAREWPNASVKAIECAWGDHDIASIAAAIVAELRTGGPAVEVVLGPDGCRSEPCLADAALPATRLLDLGPSPVVLATGGGRGITAAALLAMAGRDPARFVLIGRTPLDPEPTGLATQPTGEARNTLAAMVEKLARTQPAAIPTQLRAQAARVLAAREVNATLDALRRAGSQARYLSLDIRDQAALADALAGVRGQWGPISGVLHGAGVLGDALIANKADETFDQVFDTKVAGLAALLAATRDDPLRLLCAFTSVTGVFGNAGQCDYAMANATVDAVLAAQAAHRRDCLVRTIAWGPWDGGLLAPAALDYLRERGIPLISLADGPQAFLAELDAGPHPARVIRAAGAPAQLAELIR